MLITLSAPAFIDHFLPHVLKLATDPVANVRLAAATVVCHQRLQTADFAVYKSQIVELVRALKEDRDSEVRRLVTKQ